MATPYRYPPGGITGSAQRPPQGQARRSQVPQGQPVPDPAFWAARNQATLDQDAARRRATKPSDLDLPEGSLEFAPKLGAAYNALRAYEKGLDALMTKKMLEYQERVITNIKQRRRLRIYVWAEVENQPWQLDNADDDTFDFTSSDNATYKIVIAPRLVSDPWDQVNLSSENRDSQEGNDDVEPDAMDSGVAIDAPSTGITSPEQQDKSKKTLPQDKNPCHFIKQINFEFDRGKDFPDQYPTISWTAPPVRDDTDKNWILKRRGDDNMNVTIQLHRDENPERYDLSRALQCIVQEEDATKAEVLTAIYDYIKINKLQEDDDKRTVRCDRLLKEVFNNRDTIFFHEIPMLISHNSQHLLAYRPISIPFTIRVDKEFHELDWKDRVTVVDATVWIDDPVRAKIIAFTGTKQWQDQLRHINEIDDELALIMQNLKVSVSRLRFFKALSEDPVEAMKRWLISQQRDMEIIMGEWFANLPDGTLPDALRRGGDGSVWDSDAVREAVNYMLSKPEAMAVIRETQQQQQAMQR